MHIVKNLVLLLKAEKSEENEDHYEVVISKNGFRVVQLKTIDFCFINMDVLKEKIDNPDRYQGIIFSSPRCVHAVKRALNEAELNLEWMSKSNYAVGDATYKTALNILRLECMGRDSGNGANLSDIIIKDLKNISKPFLMPCSSIKTDTIQNRMQECGINLDVVTVYNTIPNPNLKQEIAKLTENFVNIPESIVFFSPSGVKSFANCKDELKNVFHSIKFVSIGPTTAKAMEDAGLNVHAIAEKPNPEELLKAILK